MIIDFHTHTFPSKIAGGVLQKLQKLSRSKPYTDATADGLRRSMERAHIDLSILLPVMTNVGQVHKLNEAAARTNERWQETGLLSFGGMHPDTPDYRAELAHMQHMGLRGYLPEWEARLDDPLDPATAARWTELSGLRIDHPADKTRGDVLQAIYELTR